MPIKSTATIHQPAEEYLAGLLARRVPMHSRWVLFTSAIWLLTPTELATIEVQPPAERPRVTDVASETAARIYDLDHHGLLERLSGHRLAHVLRKPYDSRREPQAIEPEGLAMLAEADRAGAIVVTVGAEPVPGVPDTLLRTLRLHQRVAELDRTYDSFFESIRRSKLRRILDEQSTLAEPVWATTGSGGQRG